MIPSTPPKRSRARYAAYCTKVSSHTISALTLPRESKTAASHSPGPDVSDAKCRCGRSDLGSHQALTGRTGADAQTNDDAGCGLKIPPNFSFAKVSRSGRNPDREDGQVPVVCSKETQHWWGWRLRKKWFCSVRFSLILLSRG